jgi:hypothetical protein
MHSELLHRIRWANVALALVALGAVSAILLWPDPRPADPATAAVTPPPRDPAPTTTAPRRAAHAPAVRRAPRPKVHRAHRRKRHRARHPHPRTASAAPAPPPAAPVYVAPPDPGAEFTP